MSDLAMILEQLDTSTKIENAAAGAYAEGQTASVSLNKEFGLVLLQKFSSDDEYRLLYETDPAKALAAIGVSADVITSLPSTSLAPMKLADKNTMLSALRLLRRDAVELCICQHPPQAKLTLGGTAVTLAPPHAIPLMAV